MTETPTHTPLPYLRDGSLIYALDKSGTCNRITMRIEGGFAANWRRNPERTTDEEVEATAAFVHQAVNSHHRLVEALRYLLDEVGKSACADDILDSAAAGKAFAIIAEMEGRRG